MKKEKGGGGEGNGRFYTEKETSMFAERDDEMYFSSCWCENLVSF